MSENAVWNYPAPIDECPDIADYMAFYWDRVDAWYEEDEQIFQHARDPYTRIDCLTSSRHVEVMVNGVKVADTSNPILLFETGHNTRYYIPSIDVDMSALEPTDTSTMCPYKGPARYWSVTAGGETFTDYVWQVSAPLPEASKIADHLCFYDEKAEIQVIVDGEPV